MSDDILAGADTGTTLFGVGSMDLPQVMAALREIAIEISTAEVYLERKRGHQEQLWDRAESLGAFRLLGVKRERRER